MYAMSQVVFYATHYLGRKRLSNGTLVVEQRPFTWLTIHRGTGADPFGAATLLRPWDDGSASVENAKRRLRAAFEFISKLQCEYYTFHDRDIAPEGGMYHPMPRFILIEMLGTYNRLHACEQPPWRRAIASLMRLWSWPCSCR